MKSKSPDVQTDARPAPGTASSAAGKHPSSLRLHQLLVELGQLHDQKQADYGRSDDPFANVRASSAFGIPPWVGALVRLNDKVVRLQQFASRGTLANESALDSMKDIAVYALIAHVLYEEETYETLDDSWDTDYRVQPRDLDYEPWDCGDPNCEFRH